MEEQYIKKLDKILNQFILQSKKFVDYSCFPYGTHDLLSYNVTSVKLTYDFEYFSFTKSTKTLISIRHLLKAGHNEDVMMLVRSIFENYLSTRYLHENEHKLDNFIKNPIKVALAFYNVQSDGVLVNRNQEEIGKQENPSAFKMGLDKKYFTHFYDVLSRFSHCNFGLIDYYQENLNFTISKNNEPLMIRLFVIFTFTKIFELVVTVEGEEFIDERTEKICYQLVEDSIMLQEKIMNFLIARFNDNTEEFLKYHSKRMKSLFKSMKKSLKEEIGSIKK
ncbi:hypothetical protein GH861_28320 [Bacillus thuringiensis]|nr:hypothetical protein [Bacillus thuringiensis]